MNKYVKYLLFTAAGFIFLLFLVFGGKLILVFKLPTIANEPNLKVNTYILATKFKSPELGNFVCYTYKYGDTLEKRVHRLCGRGGDEILIKDGVVFRNGKNIDKDLALLHGYNISSSEYTKIAESVGITPGMSAMRIQADTLRIFLEDKFAEANVFTSRRLVEKENVPDKAIYAVYRQNWNKDNFGPLKIPPGKIFVLGDNRDDSEDSRYIGLIEEDAIIATVLKH
jgi:signal peptidase I